MAAQRLKLDDTVVIPGLVSKAIVAPVMPQWWWWGAESPSEIDPSGTKIAVVCLCATFVSFVYACCVCLWKIQPTQGLPNPGISSLAPSGDRGRVLEGGSVRSGLVVPPFLYPCGGINGRIEEVACKEESAGGEILK